MTGISRSSLIARCRQQLEASRLGYLAELESLDKAAAGETKSSAGDKYETSREMIAQSRNLMARNLAETEATLQSLERMELGHGKPGLPVQGVPADDALSEKIILGSLVETSLGWYLVGVSLGEVEILGQSVKTLTLASPLGQALRGKSAGDPLPWRGGTLKILSVRNRG